MIRRGNFRIVCVSQEFPDQPYIFDVYIDGEKAIRDGWYFGYYGITGKEMYPYLLDKEGIIDFGSGFTRRAERFGFSNILDIDIYIGAPVLIKETTTGDRKPTDYIYRIRSVENLDPTRRV